MSEQRGMLNYRDTEQCHPSGCTCSGCHDRYGDRDEGHVEQEGRRLAVRHRPRDCDWVGEHR